MNVGNTVSLPQAAVLYPAGPGSTGMPQPAAPGLFALALQDVIAYNGEIPALPVAPADEGDAGEGQWDELLALLEQWLASPQMPVEMIAGDAADQTDGFAAVEQTAWMGDGSAPKPLVAMFMKAGLPQQQAEELAQSLIALIKSGDAHQETELTEILPLVRQWLKPQTEAGVRVDARQELPMATRVVQLKGGPVLPVQPADTAAVETHRELRLVHVNRALGAYQAEMATTVRTPVRTNESTVSMNFSNNALPEGVQSGQTGIEEGHAMPVFHRLTTEQPAPVATQAPIRETVRADRFVEDVQELFVRQLKIDKAANGITHARLILHPQSLGQVRVTITADNGVITAHFAADTAAGRELLDNQLSLLRHALTQQGIQVDKLVVTQQPQQQEQTYGLNEQRENPQQHAQQEQSRQQQSHGKQPEFSFDELVEGWGDSDEETAGWMNGAFNTSA